MYVEKFLPMKQSIDNEEGKVHLRQQTLSCI